MLRENIRKSFVTLFALVLFSSCASVKISDSEFCGDMGSEGATCFTTLSSTERELDKKEWDKERFGMMCSTSATFAEWKKAILKLCKRTGACTFGQKKIINKFGSNINKHKSKSKSKRKALP